MKSENYSRRSTVKCEKKKNCVRGKKQNKTVKSKNKNNWITSYACCSPVILTMHDFPNERSASGKDIQKRREEEEREKNAFRKRRNNINWHGKVDRVHLKTSSSLLNLLESSGKPSSTPDSATGIAVPGRKTCAAQRHLDRRPSMGSSGGHYCHTHHFNRHKETTEMRAGMHRYQHSE